MTSIKTCIRKRRIRKLAERILAHQIAHTDSNIQTEMIDNSIATAKKFYATWNGR